MSPVRFATAALLLAACPALPPGADGGSGGGLVMIGGGSGGGLAQPGDAGAGDDGGADAGADAGTIGKGPFDAGTNAPAGPSPGEVTYWQLELPPGVLPFPRSGEAAALVGPDGTLVLIDVGNSNHDDEVRAAVRELNTQWLTPARGYARPRAPLEVDWVILTHFHADHIGAFAPLTSGAEPLSITKGVIHRGFVDVGPATNASDFQDVCTALRGPLAAKNVGLCTASPESACSISVRAPASGCPGLLLGDLSRADDDAALEPTFLALGGGARLELLGAGAFARQGRAVVAGPSFGVTDTNEENGRSVVGLVSHGAFRLLFAGDLSGSGAAGEPDVESFIVASHATHFGGVGVDVAHANHHARKTSSNTAWVTAAAPSDGRARNVIAGINTAYVNSPHQETLDAWLMGDRLGGGRFVVTRRAPAAGTSPLLIDADGRVTLQTVERGDGYWLGARAFASVRR
ncbi:MAG: MBL fold metallo-hydrolase [Myxococcaceae bacterium]|nr:MBL fold metallo-hydrolase [Myxococcaceae bacterium]